MRECFKDRSEEHEGTFGAEWAGFAQLVAEIVTMEHFHGDIGLFGFSDVTEVIDCHDIVVVDLGGDFRFAIKAFRIARVDAFFEVHDLEGDIAIDGEMARAIDGRETADTEDAHDFVSVIDFHADRERGIWRFDVDFGISSEVLEIFDFQRGQFMRRLCACRCGRRGRVGNARGKRRG